MFWPFFLFLFFILVARGLTPFDVLYHLLLLEQLPSFLFRTFFLSVIIRSKRIILALLQFRFGFGFAFGTGAFSCGDSLRGFSFVRAVVLGRRRNNGVYLAGLDVPKLILQCLDLREQREIAAKTNCYLDLSVLKECCILPNLPTSS